MNLHNQILKELNDTNSLVASELTAAEVLPIIPRGLYLKLKSTTSGICDCCNRWDSNLIDAACDFCNKKHGARA